MLGRSLRRLSSQVAEPTVVKSTTESISSSALPTAAAAPSRDRSGFRSRLSSFFVGVAVTSLFGYVKLSEQVIGAAEHVDSKVGVLIKSSESLKEHVLNLEKRIELLESKSK